VWSGRKGEREEGRNEGRKDGKEESVQLPDFHLLQRGEREVGRKGRLTLSWSLRLKPAILLLSRTSRIWCSLYRRSRSGGSADNEGEGGAEEEEGEEEEEEEVTRVSCSWWM